MNPVIGGGGAPAPASGHKIYWTLEGPLANEECEVIINGTEHFKVVSSQNPTINIISDAVNTIQFHDWDYWQAESQVLIKDHGAPDWQYWQPSLETVYTLTGDIDIYCVLGTCLLKGTLILMADSRHIPIEDVREGMLVQGFLAPEKVTRVLPPQIAEEWDEWQFSDGKVIKTAHRHRFYNADMGRMAYLDEWEIGDSGIDEMGKRVTLLNHIHHVEKCIHYTLFTTHNTYYADELLSGNRYSEMIR